MSLSARMPCCSAADGFRRGVDRPCAPRWTAGDRVLPAQRALGRDLDHHEVRIGSRTRIRDGVTIHHGSWPPTVVGADCLLFSHCYLAHDVQGGDGVTLSAGVSVGGHATIRDGANLGLNVMVHQWRAAPVPARWSA